MLVLRAVLEHLLEVGSVCRLCRDARVGENLFYREPFTFAITAAFRLLRLQAVLFYLVLRRHVDTALRQFWCCYHRLAANGSRETYAAILDSSLFTPKKLLRTIRTAVIPRLTSEYKGVGLILQFRPMVFRDRRPRPVRGSLRRRRRHINRRHVNWRCSITLGHVRANQKIRPIAAARKDRVDRRVREFLEDAGPKSCRACVRERVTTRGRGGRQGPDTGSASLRIRSTPMSVRRRVPSAAVRSAGRPRPCVTCSNGRSIGP